MFNKILVCLDGSKESEKILPYAEAQAKAFGSQLCLVESVGLGVMQSQDFRAPDLQKKLENEAVGYLAMKAAELRSKGLKAEYSVFRSNEAGESILDCAEEGGYDLIALATHGHCGLVKFLSGSVADHLLHKSNVPLMIIKSG
ncbi:Nucleotide-binding universal stress protein, UspA family [Dehalogenimonas formicexedens]|uniref:Nucleotide-binding universal stress protein, UspA family n=1 Tax=Dehalogenimonas formicexedens TaxID=1839801 RepID=A0A1P8F751_9CHLR|nr:universal stress protein [Dehalogenimonas formicexedens]APV44309.1 Nucleotide-binding universal stress protein, UspA family [Dehalogenimonas formicexedens]